MKIILLMALMALMTLTITATAKTIDPQVSTCVGPADAPVESIYMHGWFHQSGYGGYEQLEINNVKLLTQMANERHIRIAIPVSPNTECTRVGCVRTWNGISVARMERMAKAACGVTQLPAHRSLICFSDGAYNCQHMARSQSKCGAFSEYSKVLVIGAVNAERREGHNLSNGQRNTSPVCGNRLVEIHREPPFHRLYEGDLKLALDQSSKTPSQLLLNTTTLPLIPTDATR